MTLEEVQAVLAEHQHAEEQELRAIRLSILVLIASIFIVSVIASFTLYVNVHDQTDRQAEHSDLLDAVCGAHTDTPPPDGC